MNSAVSANYPHLQAADTVEPMSRLPDVTIPADFPAASSKEKKARESKAD